MTNIDKFEKVICEFFSEAKFVCGSEGLYQSMFYHHVRKEFGQSKIRREERVHNGKVDFIIEDGDRIIAVELKAGANGHRNSLANMKEVESKGKGLQHDLAKLNGLNLKFSKPIESWIICVDLAALGIAFSQFDIIKYSTKANAQGTCFAYLSQADDEYQTWVAGKHGTQKLIAIESTLKVGSTKLTVGNTVWNEFFSEVALDGGPECSHVGLFYHALRRAGLHHKQLASEVFFNCNRYGTRNYYIPDFAIFDDSFQGHFQLYGNNRRTIENDQYKLPVLASILEFKGGISFNAQSLGKRQLEIISDVEKLVYKIKPKIEASIGFEKNKGVSGSRYIMVVTDCDPRLQECIKDLKFKYSGVAEIRWIGDWQPIHLIE